MDRFTLRAPAALLALLAALALGSAAPVRAQTSPSAVIDTGRFVVFDHGKPVAHEDFEYDRAGDSLIVLGIARRTLRRNDGAQRVMEKKFSLVADGFDFGLRSYTSSLSFDGHTTVRGVVPGDTAMTLYVELDGQGSADRVAQPPGRLFIMDPMLFALFDVIGRNLHGHAFTARPIQLVALGSVTRSVEAQVHNAGPDTLSWGGRRETANRYVLSDSTGTFTMWVSPDGRMLRLENADNDLVVLRAPPSRAPASRTPGERSPAPRPRPH